MTIAPNSIIKKTPQRMAIMKYLDGNVSHPSASDIYEALHEQFPTMSLATVYNTMETLKRQGSVAELSIDAGKKRFDPNPKPHHHLICVHCRKIVDIFIDFPLQVPPERIDGFDIIGNHVDFYGVCSACREKQEKMTQT